MATREATHIYQSIINDYKNLLNHQKVSKYYEHDCRAWLFIGLWHTPSFPLGTIFMLPKFCMFRKFFFSYIAFQNLLLVECNPAWKVSVFEVFLVHIFPHLDWIQRDSISPYSVQMRENTDQKNSEYWDFSRSAKHRFKQFWCVESKNLIIVQFFIHQTETFVALSFHLFKCFVGCNFHHLWVFFFILSDKICLIGKFKL